MFLVVILLSLGSMQTGSEFIFVYDDNQISVSWYFKLLLHFAILASSRACAVDAFKNSLTITSLRSASNCRSFLPHLRISNILHRLRWRKYNFRFQFTNLILLISIYRFCVHCGDGNGRDRKDEALMRPANGNIIQSISISLIKLFPPHHRTIVNKFSLESLHVVVAIEWKEDENRWEFISVNCPHDGKVSLRKKRKTS